MNLVRALKAMIAAVVGLSTDDSTKLQTKKVKGTDNYVRDKVERIQNYGLTSHVPVGSNDVLVNIGATGDFPVIIASESPDDRPLGLKEGEVALYSKFNCTILLNEDGGLSIEDGNGNTFVMGPSSIVLNDHLEVLQ